MKNLNIDELIDKLIQELSNNNFDESYKIWSHYYNKFPSLHIAFDELQKSILKTYKHEKSNEKIKMLSKLMKNLSKSINNNKKTAITNKRA
jgi:hypothetical protein